MNYSKAPGGNKKIPILRVLCDPTVIRYAIGWEGLCNTPRVRSFLFLSLSFSLSLSLSSLFPVWPTRVAIWRDYTSPTTSYNLRGGWRVYKILRIPFHTSFGNVQNRIKTNFWGCSTLIYNASILRLSWQEKNDWIGLGFSIFVTNSEMRKKIKEKKSWTRRISLHVNHGG